MTKTRTNDTMHLTDSNEFSLSEMSMRAFSLVEVALALGIIAFAIVAILGLMSASLNASDDAARDTVLSTMAGNVMSELRRMPFDEVLQKPVYYFDAEGTMQNATGANDGTVYKCLVEATADPDSETQTASRPNLFNVRMVFTWPAGATASLNERSIHATVSRK